MWGRNTEPRRQLNAAAWTTQDGDFAARKCKVLISPDGAKIRCEDQRFLKATFTLKYSRDERQGRLCKVIWRKGDQVGVEFKIDAAGLRS